jgi:DNA end-binding protein Ku
VIRFGDERLPVKLFSAVEDRNIRFRLLHEPDRVPVQQRMINPSTGAVVDLAEVRKGVEIEPDRFVLVTDEDTKEIEPEDSRDILITRFLDPSLINHQWYERPYHLGPDDNPTSYYSFARVLERKGLERVARWVMRKKRYRGALRARDGHLLLITLRHAGEVIPRSELEAPSGRKLEAKERDMAVKFIKALEEDFEPDRYEDEYRERVAHLIEIERRGGTVKIEEYEEPKAPDELLELLEASLAAVS